MPDNPFRQYCPLCDKDYALEAFVSHIEFPTHIMAAAWGLRATVEHLTEIRKLLQQLVDKDKQVTATTWLDLPYKCMICQIGWPTYEDANTHWVSGEHERMLARSGR